MGIFPNKLDICDEEQIGCYSYGDHEKRFIHIDAPGLKPEEIEVNTNETHNNLIIKFKRKSIGNKFNFTPISYILGKFTHYPLLNSYDYTATQWNYENGVIILQIPYKKESNKKIPISNIRISENV